MAKLTFRQGKKAAQFLFLLAIAAVFFHGTPGRAQTSLGFLPATPSTNTMRLSRSGHEAVLLPDGRVFITGGYLPEQSGSTRLDIYDPSLRLFKSTSLAVQARVGSTATLLQNGTVITIGGLTNVITAPIASRTAEIFDPSTGLSTLTTGSMAVAREGHTATLLQDGRVLVTGGWNYPNNVVLAGAEIYDPATGTFTAIPSMNTPRVWHTATLLPNGNVLIAGGLTTGGSTAVSSLELYDPTANSFQVVGSMFGARYSHTATLLPNGKVFICGGSPGSGNSSGLASGNLYDSNSGTVTPTQSMPVGVSNHAATLLATGGVLITGGNNIGSSTVNNAVLYNPNTGTFTSVTVMNSARAGHTATLLGNGNVLVAGGSSSSINTLNTGELYDETYLFNNLVANINSLSNQVATLTTQLTALSSTNANLQSQLDAANATISSLTTQLNAVTAANVSLTAQLAQSQADLLNANNTISSLTDSNSSLSNQVDSLTATNSVLSNQVVSLSATVSQLQAQLSAAQAQIQSQNAQIASLTQNNTDLQNSLNSALAANQTLAGQVNSLTAANTVLQNQIDATTTQMLSLTGFFQTTFRNSSFQIQGNTSDQKVQSVVTAIEALKKTQAQPIYSNLTGK